MLREKRDQPRIRAQAQVAVQVPGTDRAERARLDDLSWGGARVRCGRRPGEPGDPLELHLPYKPGHPVRIAAEILRIDSEDDDGCVLALRFASLSPADQTHLEAVLEKLMAGGDSDRRVHARLAQRLEIYFDDPADIRATLEDISQGGLSVTVPYSFSLNQSVQLTVAGGELMRDLVLRARVVHQTPVTEGKLELHRVGLKLEHPRDELQEIVKRLLRRISRAEALASRKWKKK